MITKAIIGLSFNMQNGSNLNDILLVAALIVGVAGYHYSVVRSKDKSIEFCKTEYQKTEQILVEERDVTSTLRKSIDKQNASILEMKQIQERNQETAKRLVEEANRKAEVANKRAEELMKMTKPEGVNDCIATNELINGELWSE